MLLMETNISRQKPLKILFKDTFSLVYENRKLVVQFNMKVLFIALGNWFFKHEQSELSEFIKLHVKNE